MECQLERITVHYEAFGDGIPLIAFHARPMDGRAMASALEPIFESRASSRRSRTLDAGGG